MNTASTRSYDSREFHDGFWRVVYAAVPVALAVAVGDAIPIPGLSVFVQITGVIVFIIVTSYFLYSVWELIQDGAVRTTPGRAVGYRFIPLFSLYWEFVAVYGLAKDLNGYAAQHNVPERASEGWALTHCILVVANVALCWVPYVTTITILTQIVAMLILFHGIAVTAAAIVNAKGLAGPASDGE
jgi:hypothetical protein